MDSGIQLRGKGVAVGFLIGAIPSRVFQPFALKIYSISGFRAHIPEVSIDFRNLVHDKS